MAASYKEPQATVEILKDFVLATKYNSGGCESCGFDLNKGILQFHHRDPKSKVEAVGTMIRQPGKYSLKDVMNEVAKCDLLCPTCHQDLHDAWRKATGFANVPPSDPLPVRKKKRDRYFLVDRQFG